LPIFAEGIRAGKLRAQADLGDREVSICYAGGEFNVRHLPPIVLEFLLPEHYPSEQSPEFRIKSEWLTKKQVDPF
jgi:hypothetical protein